MENMLSADLLAALTLVLLLLLLLSIPNVRLVYQVSICISLCACVCKYVFLLSFFFSPTSFYLSVKFRHSRTREVHQTFIPIFEPVSKSDTNIYGSVSAGREKWPFNVLFFFFK